MAANHKAICVFVNDALSASTIETLRAGGTELILLRCAGFNQVDLPAAKAAGMPVLRVPAYSPYAVAEFAVALLLSVCRKTHKMYNRTRESNFTLHGLMGFDIHGKTVGVCGTGKIGRLFAKIMLGFGSKVLAYDIYPSEEARKMGVEYVELDELLQRADIISLHCPLSDSTRYMIDEQALGKVKRGAVLINTSRGELVEMEAVIAALRDGKLGGCGMDVVEGEADLFFDDHSGEVLQNENVERLISLPNVLLTPHAAFCTDNALENIWKTTVRNAVEFVKAEGFSNQVGGES